MTSLDNLSDLSIKEWRISSRMFESINTIRFSENLELSTTDSLSTWIRRHVNPVSNKDLIGILWLTLGKKIISEIRSIIRPDLHTEDEISTIIRKNMGKVALKYGSLLVRYIEHRVSTKNSQEILCMNVGYKCGYAFVRICLEISNTPWFEIFKMMLTQNRLLSITGWSVLQRDIVYWGNGWNTGCQLLVPYEELLERIRDNK